MQRLIGNKATQNLLAQQITANVRHNPPAFIQSKTRAYSIQAKRHSLDKGNNAVDFGLVNKPAKLSRSSDYSNLIRLVSKHYSQMNMGNDTASTQEAWDLTQKKKIKKLYKKSESIEELAKRFKIDQDKVEAWVTE